MAVNLNLSKFLAGLVFVFPVSACSETSDLVPVAIAAEEDLEELDALLDSMSMCHPNRSYEDLRQDAAKIDMVIGHSRWAWSCVDVHEENWTFPEKRSDATWPNKDQIFDAAVALRDRDDGLFEGWSSSDLYRAWPSGAFTHYEMTIDILLHDVRVVKAGIGYTGLDGRYLAFNANTDGRINAVNKTLIECREMTGDICVPAFFSDAATIYPTIYRQK